MVESTDKASPIMQAQAGANAATDLSSLIERIEGRSEISAQKASLRQNFAAIGIVVDDEEIQLFYQKIKALEPEQAIFVVQDIAAQIVRFRTLGEPDFGYRDWQSVQELERNFLDFGLTFEEPELLQLYQADTVEACKLFRAKIHVNLKRMLELIARENEELPAWLVEILEGRPGAEEVILHETSERETYKNLLNTLFDSHGLTDRRYLIEQVLDSWS